MAQNKKFRFGPVALTNTYTTNILNPPTATGGVNGGSSSNVIILYHIHVANKGGLAATFRLFIDATGGNTAGKEVAYNKNVPADDFVDLYFPSGLRLDAADFLVGGASAATTLTIMGEGEIGVV